jgi:hypothetical protein
MIDVLVENEKAPFRMVEVPSNPQANGQAVSIAVVLEEMLKQQ